MYRSGSPSKFYMKRELNQNLSGNDVYYAACSLVILRNSLSKLHCQKGFDLIPLSCKIMYRSEGYGPPSS